MFLYQSWGEAAWIPLSRASHLFVIGQMEMPLNPCRKYPLLCLEWFDYLYILASGLGLLLISVSCGLPCIRAAFSSVTLPGCRCDGVLHLVGLIGEDKVEQIEY